MTGPVLFPALSVIVRDFLTYWPGGDFPAIVLKANGMIISEVSFSSTLLENLFLG